MFGNRKIFKVPVHQKFSYKPMHYDPRKEELEERLRTLTELQRDDIAGAKSRIASGLRSGYLADQTYRQQQIRRSNLVIVGVVIMLLVLGYLLLNVYLPELTKFTE
ncbi:MAG: hypothetical protein DA408_14805 [Bacteroidetes bacterium]|nr:MAG: hypothetical protein C7N36_09815 [Bacteroidota bacterium]PTM10893.1 MAG: hypothetical protein DA408_14805 [Bacteroidota bacterium]